MARRPVRSLRQLLAEVSRAQLRGAEARRPRDRQRPAVRAAGKARHRAPGRHRQAQRRLHRRRRVRAEVPERRQRGGKDPRARPRASAARAGADTDRDPDRRRDALRRDGRATERADLRQPRRVELRHHRARELHHHTEARAPDVRAALPRFGALRRLPVVRDGRRRPRLPERPPRRAHPERAARLESGLRGRIVECCR
jgi:hypothetical protein